MPLATNSPAISRPLARRKPRLIWLFVLLALPLLLLAIVAAAVSIYEFRQASALRGLVQKLKQTQQPYDDDSLRAWYDSHTSDEGTAQWLEIVDAVTATHSLATALGAYEPLYGALNPIAFDGSPDPPTEGIEDWANTRFVSEFLDDVQPLLKRIHSTVDLPTPVRFPIVFRGVGTLLPHVQESRSIARLLRLDCEYAVQKQASDRALRDLQSMMQVAKAIDSGAFMVVDFVVNAILREQRAAITRSLSQSFWSAEHLVALRKVIGERRYNTEHWKAIMASERAAVGKLILAGDTRILESHDSEMTRLIPLLPSGKLALLENYDHMAALGETPLENLSNAAFVFERQPITKLSSFFNGHLYWHGQLFPAMWSYANAIIGEEDSRRLTLTAVGIRQYHQLHDQWPEHLSDLASVGLSTDDHTTVNRGSFGYQVENGVAYVWSYPLGAGQAQPVPAERTKQPGSVGQFEVIELH